MIENSSMIIQQKNNKTSYERNLHQSSSKINELVYELEKSKK
jgi:hypothetical protein